MSGDLKNHVEELSLQEDHIENQKKSEDDQVDPWNVVSKSEAGIDYDKLIREYYCDCLKEFCFISQFTIYEKYMKPEYTCCQTGL